MAQPDRPELVLDRARSHGTEFDVALGLCADALRREPSLRYVAHCTFGQYDFAWHNLEPGSMLDPVELHRMALRVAFDVEQLNRTLSEARTGDLIRVVLQTTMGAVYCNAVRPQQYVVGVSLASADPDLLPTDVPGVRAADMTLTWLADALRGVVSLGSQNPGGWAEAEPDTGPPPGTSPSAHLTTFPEVATDVVKELASVVLPDAVHYAAQVTDGELTAVVDQFEDPALAPFFTQTSPAGQRHFYRDFLAGMQTRTATFSRALATAPGGRLLRVVLDVEQGVFCWYRLAPAENLAGLTLDQSRVSRTDHMLALLSHRLRTSNSSA